MWDNLLIIIFVDLDFVETMPLVEFLCVVVGNLDMKVYLIDFGLYLCRGSGEDKLQTSRPQFPWAVRLCYWIAGSAIKLKVHWRETRLAAKTPIVMRYKTFWSFLFSKRQQIVPTWGGLCERVHPVFFSVCHSREYRCSTLVLKLDIWLSKPIQIYAPSWQKSSTSGFKISE